MAKIKVLIVDDHQIFRDGLCSLLEKEPDMELLGEAEDGRTILKMLKEMAPEVIIMDVSMPDLNGIEATRQIAHEFPAVKVVALSVHDDRGYVINMLKSGASGYLLKDCAFRELVKAIRVVVTENKIYLSPAITDIVINNFAEFAEVMQQS